MQGNTYRIGTRHVEVLQKISEGGFAYVYKAQDRATGEIFALKKIMCQSQEGLSMALREVNIMKCIP